MLNKDTNIIPVRGAIIIDSYNECMIIRNMIQIKHSVFLYFTSKYFNNLEYILSFTNNAPIIKGN
jgi:hypothetical protein